MGDSTRVTFRNTTETFAITWFGATPFMSNQDEGMLTKKSSLMPKVWELKGLY